MSCDENWHQLITSLSYVVFYTCSLVNLLLFLLVHTDYDSRQPQVKTKILGINAVYKRVSMFMSCCSMAVYV